MIIGQKSRKFARYYRCALRKKSTGGVGGGGLSICGITIDYRQKSRQITQYYRRILRKNIHTWHHNVDYWPNKSKIDRWGVWWAWAVVVPYGLKSHLIIGQQNRKKCSILLARFEEKSTFGRGGEHLWHQNHDWLSTKKSENCSILYQAYWEKNLQGGGCCGIKITINYRPKKSENSLDIMGAYRDRKIARYYSCVLRWSSAKKVEKLIDIIGAYSDRNRRGGDLSTYL